jgi:hypothetical protein
MFLDSAYSNEVIWSTDSNFRGTGESIQELGDSIYVCGHSYSENNPIIQKRSKKDGSIIWEVSSSMEVITSSDLDSSGIYLSGNIGVSDTKWKIEKRRLNEGSIIWEQEVNPSPNSEGLIDIILHDDFLYLLGTDSTNEDRDIRIEKRKANDGSLEWYKVLTLSKKDDIGNAIFVDSSGIYICGGMNGDADTGVFTWFAEKIKHSDQSQIWLMQEDSLDEGWATDLSIYKSSLYVVGAFRSQDGDWDWRIENRNLNDGELNWGDNYSPTVRGDSAYCLFVDDSGVYIGGYDGSENWSVGRVEKREFNGEQIWSNQFNIDTSYHSEVVRDIVSDGSALYCIGYSMKTDQTWIIQKMELGAQAKPIENNIGNSITENISGFPLYSLVIGLLCYHYLSRIQFK